MPPTHFASAPAAWAAGAGLRHERHGAADLLLLEAVPIGHFNRLVGLGVETPASEEMLDTALARFAAAGIEGFFVHLSPGAQPAALPGWLRRVGSCSIAAPGSSSGGTIRRRQRCRRRSASSRSGRTGAADFRARRVRGPACRLGSAPGGRAGRAARLAYLCRL